MYKNRKKQNLSTVEQKELKNREVTRNHYSGHKNPNNMTSLERVERRVNSVLDRILNIQPRPEQNQQDRQADNQRDNTPNLPLDQIQPHARNLRNNPSQVRRIAKKELERLRQQSVNLSTLSNTDIGNAAMRGVFVLGVFPSGSAALTNFANWFFPDLDAWQENDLAAQGGAKHGLDSSMRGNAQEIDELAESGSTLAGNAAELQELENPSLNSNPCSTRLEPTHG